MGLGCTCLGLGFSLHVAGLVSCVHRIDSLRQQTGRGFALLQNPCAQSLVPLSFLKFQENDGLQDSAEFEALYLVNDIEKVVEEEWAALEEHYKKLRASIRAGEASNATQEAQRAWLFYSRAQFLLGNPQEQRHLAVWKGGGIDPRLLAGLTALSFFAGEILSNQTIDRGELAPGLPVCPGSRPSPIQRPWRPLLSLTLSMLMQGAS